MNTVTRRKCKPDVSRERERLIDPLTIRSLQCAKGDSRIEVDSLSRIETMARSCEHGNEGSSRIK